jgi:putative membrane-bound dehydrogenase-like protein
MRSFFICVLTGLIWIFPEFSFAGDGNRLTYLDENDPYYVSRTFPKLITPQWIGEEGVEAVVVLAIDDMREPEKYEGFLRPILERLKKIDGRAPVSIMTNQVNPRHPLLQQWLREGLSIETHTFDHPCPLLGMHKKGKAPDLATARANYEDCVDLISEIPGSHPVAFRMPCCDSLNTVSPRFYAEIFNQRTAKGNFLQLDSSVFNLLTSNDPDLSRELVIDPDGQDRFLKYLPYDRTFVNTIENYAYPYVIGRLCWEFPCIFPSDWEAQHYHKPNNPITVRDLEAALDAIVIKQGSFNLVFHPHGWIRNDQIVQLIDHAVARHGKKVKFLTFREALELLNKNLLAGQAVRDAKGRDNGIRLLDLNNDGYLDVVIGNDQVRQTRIWSPASHTWAASDFPVPLVQDGLDQGVRFGVVGPDHRVSFLLRNEQAASGWQFDGTHWLDNPHLLAGLQLEQGIVSTSGQGRDLGVRLRDLDGDGTCELVVGSDRQQAIFHWAHNRWEKLPFTLPPGARLADSSGREAGLRFLDMDGDGHDDVLFSNETGYGLYLFTSREKGWSRRALSGKRGDPGELPMISRNATNNGAWFHSRHLFVQNEDTALLRDHVDRRSFNDLLQPVEPTARSPEASLHSIQTRPGFTVELMASEPLLQSPIYMAWGPDGKLWVVEMGDYPLGADGKGSAGGRIKFLEDTHGTGKYDRATLFLDGLHYPTGVLPWGKGVIVTCAPEIFYAEDTDGDGKADLHRTLYVGFEPGNPQHRVNGLTWGLDNWIYGANGDSGGRVKSLKTGAEVDIRGRDFRIRPDHGLLEAETGETQFGRCGDDWGNWFGCNNSDPMYQFMLPDHYVRRNPHLAAPNLRVQVSVTPGASAVYPISRTLPRFNDFWAANHFTSACSVIVYRDDLFGPNFIGNSFVSEPVHNLVHREIMNPRGVAFSSHRAVDEQHSEFWASTDNWTRPTTIRVGPDGALWIADMYRQVIEHPEWIPLEWQKRLDLLAGHDRGRIYRVYPTGKSPRPIPRLDRLDTAGLVGALDSPSGWQRDMVQQMLIWKGDLAAVPLLEKVAGESPRPQTRLQALCTLDGLDALKPEVLEPALGDSHPGVRRHAVRLFETRLAQAPNLGDALIKLVDDPDPQVRMQLACTLGEWPNPRAGTALGRIAVHDRADTYISAAVLSSVNQTNLEPMLAAVLSGDKETPPPPALVANLLRLANSLGLNRAVITLLKHVAAARNGHYESWQFTALADLLDALDQRNTTLVRLAKQGDQALRQAVERLGGLFDAARAAVGDGQRPAEERLQAIRLLGRGLEHQQEDRELLIKLLVPQTEPELQAAAVASLGRLRDGRVPEDLLRGWKGYAPPLRARILDVLLQRDDWSRAVLDAVEHQQILVFEIDAVRRQRLLQHRDASVRQRAARLLASAVNPDRQKVVASYRSVLNLKGHAGRGQLAFGKICASCHQLGGIGHVVGPDLASLGDKSTQSLLVAILDPNRAVEARYLNYMAQTRNGLTLTGVLASETGNSITLVGPEGKQQVILRNDLEELTSTNKSVMPEGLEKDLKPQDMADLIAFIQAGTPVAKRKVFEGNQPELVRPESDGNLWLLPTTCDIYGSTLVLEKQYGNLGYWSSEDDRAVWSVDVVRPGRYAVYLNWACQNDSAGNIFVLQAGPERLTGKVQGTGTWDNYRQTKVGEIALAAGRQQLIFRSVGKPAGALIDLRAIKLMPLAN